MAHLMKAKLKTALQIEALVTTTEMHTAGESVRIIESGYLMPQGRTLLDKLQYLQDYGEDLKNYVLWEPRGHSEMNAVLLVAPDNPEADVAVIFMHHDEYSAMCGHITIALGRYAIDKGLLKRPITCPYTDVKIQAPCGLVTATVEVQNENGVMTTGPATFESVPAYVVYDDFPVEVEGLGTINVDVAYGGNFFLIVTASDLGLDLETSSFFEITKKATMLNGAAHKVIKLSHPLIDMTWKLETYVVDSRHCLTKDHTLCAVVFALDMLDRSPCGSGTTAMTKLLHHRGLLKVGQPRVFKNATTGSEFKAWVNKETMVNEFKAATICVQGQGYYTGYTTMILEKGDTIGRGFLPRS